MQNYVHEKLSAGLRICTLQETPWFLLWQQTPPPVLVFPHVNLRAGRALCWKVNKHMHIWKYLLYWKMKMKIFFDVCGRWCVKLFSLSGEEVSCLPESSDIPYTLKLPHKAWFLWLKRYCSIWFRFKRAELLKDFLTTASPSLELFMSVLPCYSLR